MTLRDLHFPNVPATRGALAIKFEPFDFPRLSIAEAERELGRLRYLTEGWDGEDAPAPNRQAIECAGEVVFWAICKGLTITEVDADVLGGVAIWLSGRSKRSAWIACMNSGGKTVVFKEGTQIWHRPWGDEARQELLRFLSGGHEQAPR